jgi:hypothetical protein
VGGLFGPPAFRQAVLKGRVGSQPGTTADLAMRGLRAAKAGKAQTEGAGFARGEPRVARALIPAPRDHGHLRPGSAGTPSFPRAGRAELTLDPEPARLAGGWGADRMSQARGWGLGGAHPARMRPGLCAPAGEPGLHSHPQRGSAPPAARGREGGSLRAPERGGEGHPRPRPRPRRASSGRDN